MPKSTDDTGVALLVFDRPAHTRQVLGGLEGNDIDHLYVFADGPMSTADANAIEATRDVVRDISFCEVDYVFRDKNLGLRRSWIAAYEHLFDRHRKAIVLENDCVPSDDFVRFMRSCLDKYEDNPRVMNVHGYSPPIDIFDSYPYDAFFTWRSGSHGQGTWRDAWRQYEEDPALLDRIESDEAFRAKVNRAGTDLLPMLRRQLSGDADSVQVWWSLALIANDGISITPVRSRINNIGHDGSGRHSVPTNRYSVDIDGEVGSYPLVLPERPEVDPELHRGYVEFMCASSRSNVDRAIEIYRSEGLVELARRTWRHVAR